MTQNELKTYFGSPFQGMESIIGEIFTPTFGEFEAKSNPCANNYVSQYGNGGANIKRIFDYGNYTIEGSQVSVWEVVLADNCHIARARKNIQEIVRRIMGNYNGAFIAFHYDDDSSNADRDTWRLSWVKRLDKNSATTSAKRYTYLCGPEYSCRTIAERFDALQEKKRKTLDTVTSVFDVEALSDEFFYNYRALYSKILGEGERGKSKYNRYNELNAIPEDELGFCDFLERHKDDASYFGEEFNKWEEKVRRDYIKKLMGRLVFLQFLQKKGWMCGDVNYLKNIFERHVQANGEKVFDTTPGSFLDCVLEPLFFGVLNTKVKDRKELFSKKGWDLKLLSEWENIPYLNGGLFEQEEFDIPKSAFPNMLFNELLTLFSEYNFTIDENDPNDSEIGIDPEMLGKIFESQLEDNKDKGAFYTPKDFVQYMCRESLIAYLQTKVSNHDDEIRQFVDNSEVVEVPEKDCIYAALKEVKICDPAIGSGAFPMGLLNLLVALREKLGDTDSRYELKKDIIQNNIFGVDIEKGAVDIARLRFWLSIVIDEENNNPHALPNLDYQIVQGNSLLHRFGKDASFKDVFGDYNRQNKTKFTLQDYKEWVTDYLNTTEHEKKEEFRKKIEDVKSCLRFELTKKEKNKEIKLKEKINLIETATLLGDLDSEQKKQIAELKKQLKELEEKHQDILDNAVFKDAFEWRFEFPQLLNEKGDFVGFDIVIGNPPYFVYQGVNKSELPQLRKISDYSISFGGKLNAYKLFLAVAIKFLAKKDGINCFIFQNSFMADLQAVNLRKYVLNNCQILKIDSFPERDNKKKRVFENVKMSVCILFVQNNLFDKPFSVNVWDDKYKTSGMTTHFTKGEIEEIDPEGLTIPRLKENAKPIVLKMLKKKNIKIKCWEGELNISFHQKYFSTDSSLPVIMKGAGIQKFYYTYDMSQGQVEYLNEGNYLKECGKSKKAMHHKYSRIVMQGMTGANDKIRLIMTIIPPGMYLGNSCNYILPVKDIPQKTLLGLMNSKLLNFFFRSFSTNSNVNGYEVDTIPICSIQDNISQQIEGLVDTIMSVKQKNNSADTSKLEQKIDELVYHLYNLTYDEVLVVDPDTHITREEYEQDMN